MLKGENFYIKDFESINEESYLQRKNIPNIFHTFKWMKIIKDTLDVECKIALLKKNDLIIASIPFVSYRNLIKGKCALPLLFSGYYGSIYADNDNFKKNIFNKFLKYCQEYNLFTQIPEIHSINKDKFFFGYSIYKIELDANSSVEKQILALANKRMREYIKQAIKSKLQSFIGSTDLLNEFYILYLQNMKELGTPPLQKKFFKKILESFSNVSKIILIKDQNKFCSGVFLLKVSKSELFAQTICTPRAYQTDQSTHLVYLEAVREAQKLGCSVMNFGRSINDSGPAIFKKRFGLKATPLLMYSSDKNWTVTNPKNSILRYAVLIWKKLPILLTKIGGIIFAKHVI